MEYGSNAFINTNLRRCLQANRYTPEKKCCKCNKLINEMIIVRFSYNFGWVSFSWDLENVCESFIVSSVLSIMSRKPFICEITKKYNNVWLNVILCNHIILLQVPVNMLTTKSLCKL